MPDNQKGNISGSADSSTSVRTGTDTLTDQDVATRYGLSEDKVHAFCSEFGLVRDGGHYVIPPNMLPRLESWAEQKGYAINKT